MVDDYDDIQAGAIAAPQIAELPEIKLFGRWSCDDVQVSDMSLQVGLLFFFTGIN
jgi:small subunit ribosomal protein S5e